MCHFKRIGDENKLKSNKDPPGEKENGLSSNKKVELRPLNYNHLRPDDIGIGITIKPEQKLNPTTSSSS
jgi:hypothetical protein